MNLKHVKIIYQFQGIQPFHNDKGSHKRNHILNRMRIDNISHVLVHFCVNLANAKFSRILREESPFYQQPKYQ